MFSEKSRWGLKLKSDVSSPPTAKCVDISNLLELDESVTATYEFIMANDRNT